MSDDDGARPQRERAAPKAEEKKADEPDEPDAKPDEADAGEKLCHLTRR